ncbi:polygalacturonase-like isoform X2 [Anoplophora glabripennis]|nr:polygalacturonase-like isoform X2 [Anoplophora glabripennis]
MGHFVALFVLLLSAVACHSASQNATAVSCTISKYNLDHINQAQSECSEITIDSLIVPYGVTLDLTKLKTGAKLIFRGTTVWQYEEWEGPLLKIKGTNVEVTGSDDHVLDGRGALWWDGKGGNGGKVKPHFMKATVTNSVIHKLNIKNTPVQAFSVNGCIDSVVQYITIDNKDGDTKGGHNTDAFNVNSCNNITIKHCTVYNQDDCMAMNSGYNTYFLDNYCSGGHGISIGSVGNGATVQGVLVDGCQIVDSDNGIRIKTKYGETGSVSDVTYQNIVLKNIHRYGITMQGDYGSSGGVPTGGVPISHLTLKNVTGTVDKGGANIYILVENASDWHFSDINVTGGQKKMSCKGIPAGTGVSC